MMRQSTSAAPPRQSPRRNLTREERPTMRLAPLYLLRFTYPEGWELILTGDLGAESQDFYLAEGHCEGRIAGRFRAANAPRRRTDKTCVAKFHGGIETKD